MSSDTSNMLYKHYRYLLELVKAAVNERAALKPPPDISWEKIYQISCETMFSCPVFYAVSTLPQNTVPRSIYENFFVNFQKSVSQDTERDKFLNLMTDFCEEEKIDIMPLKGSYLREFYPQPEMRYMIDADILIHEEDSKNIDAFLVRRGFILRSPGEIHDEYICKRTGIIVEIHKKLISDSKRNATFFSGVWERAVLRKGCRNTYRMSDVDFFTYLSEHCVHHFFHGGITARMILDFYILGQKISGRVDRECLRRALLETGLLKFTRSAVNLAYDWFSEGGAGLQNDSFSRFVMLNGKMGSLRNLVITNAASLTGEGETTTCKYVLGRLFPSRKVLSENFPVLNKRPVLMPFMLFAWWFRKMKSNLFVRGKKFKTIPYIKSLDQEQRQVENARRMIQELEIDPDM